MNSTGMDDSTRYCFTAEWYDPQAALLRDYQVFLYPKDNSVEIFDVKTRRTFLRKTKVESLKPADFFLGNVINMYSRQMTLKAYGDDFTRKALSSSQQSTLAIIKPDAIRFKGEILQALHRDGFKVVQMQMVSLSRQEAQKFYAEHQGKPFFNDLTTFMSSGPSLVLEVMRPNAINRWRDLLENTVRPRFASDATRNAAHGSDSAESASVELEFFFSRSCTHRPNTARVNDSTLCVVKPSAVKEGQLGEIVRDIDQAGFQVTAIKSFVLEKSDAEEFLEIYKGVVTEYADMVAELCSGVCVALEVAAEGDPTKFRGFVGPADPEIARHLRPNSLRAKYGVSKAANGVHVTDLADDAPLEVEYFFRILSR
jgi:nucleoside-diphosphate kinase